MVKIRVLLTDKLNTCQKRFQVSPHCTYGIILENEIGQSSHNFETTVLILMKTCTYLIDDQLHTLKNFNLIYTLIMTSQQN